MANTEIKTIQIGNSIYNIRDNLDYLRRHYKSTDVTGVAGTSTTQLSTTFNVTDNSITEYYDGLMISFTLPCASVSTYGSVFQINSLGYKPIVYNVNTYLNTRYSAGATVIMVYNSSQTGPAYLTKNTKTTIEGCWQIMDYDSNSNTLQRTYRTATNVEVPLAAASTGSSTSAWAEPTTGSYKDAYGVVCDNTAKRATMNPSTGKITFNGDVLFNGSTKIGNYNVATTNDIAVAIGDAISDNY